MRRVLWKSTRPVWHFIDGLLHGNLGYSFFTQQSVNTMLKQDLPPTLSLVIGGVIIWLVVGLSVGILSATRSRSLFDRLSNVAVLIGLSLPVFVIGEVLILVVFVPLNQHGITWIQTGYVPITQGFFTWMGHMILPWITLAATEAAIYTRLIRGQLLDTLGEDYIRTARSKGLSERRVVFRHGVRAALTRWSPSSAWTSARCSAAWSSWRWCSASAASARPPSSRCPRATFLSSARAGWERARAGGSGQGPGPAALVLLVVVLA